MSAFPGKTNPNYKNGKYYKSMPRICPNCQVKFMVKPIEVERGWGIYCSVKCRAYGTARRKYIEGINDRRIIKGYIYIYKPSHPYSNSGGFIAEHRLVIEKSLGRYLTKEEIVHHKNRNKQDNNLENLVLLKDKSEHHYIHLNDIVKNMENYWTPEKRKEQAERVRKLRKIKFWSTKRV